MTHNEYNRSRKEPVSYLQIWSFPREYDLPPRYQKADLAPQQENSLLPVIDPEGKENTASINQDLWVYRGRLNAGKSISYSIRDDRFGVYVFLIDGDVTIEGTKLKKRDGMGVWALDTVSISADSDSDFILIEVPMRK